MSLIAKIHNFCEFVLLPVIILSSLSFLNLPFETLNTFSIGLSSGSYAKLKIIYNFNSSSDRFVNLLVCIGALSPNKMNF